MPVQLFRGALSFSLTHNTFSLLMSHVAWTRTLPRATVNPVSRSAGCGGGADGGASSGTWR
eukprot:506669-Rhodomonas_salina.1